MAGLTTSIHATERTAKARRKPAAEAVTQDHRHPLVRLGNQAGNAAVVRLVQRLQDTVTLQRAEGDEEDEEDMVQALHDPAIQRQDDELEDEEEKLAQAQHDPSIQRVVQLEEGMGEEEEEGAGVSADHDEEAERGTVGLEGGPLGAKTAEQINSMRGTGSALDASLKNKMEPAFGVDLAPVRVHQDSASDSVARSITAKAFTTGSDIFLRNDVSATDSRLMAHELTHVVQQSSEAPSGDDSMRVGSADDPMEQQADSVAQSINSGAQVARLPDDDHS